MKVIKNYLYNALYQLLKVLIPVATIPYLSRVLGPTGIGINSYTNSIIQYFILIGDLGINMYGNRKVAYVRNDKYKLTQTFYEISIMQLCTIVLSYIAFFIFLLFTHQYHNYYLAQSIMIIATAFDISWFFMGMENFKITVLRNLVIRILILLCIFVFVKSKTDLLLYITLYSLSFLLGNITLFADLKKYIGLPKLSDLHVWKHLWPSITLFIPTIATQVYVMLNKTMLGYITNVQDSGFYDQSDKVIKMLLAIVTATGTVMLPHVANAFANGKIKSTKNYLYNSFSIVTALSVPMAFGISAIAPKFVPLFFTNKFLTVIPIMMIESIIIVLIAWSNAIGIQYLLPTGQTNKYTLSVTIGAITNIIINVPMIISFGVIGSMISTVISEAAVTTYQLFIVRKQINYKLLFNDLCKYLLAGIIMFMFICILNKSISFSWYSIIIEVFIGIIIYLGLMILFKVNLFKIIKKMILNNEF